MCCALCAVCLLLQRLLRAEAVDAVTAAGLTDTKTAACVSYSTAEQLSAAAKAIGVPLTLTAGVRYCYMLPTTPATQHCQVKGQDCVTVKSTMHTLATSSIEARGLEPMHLLLASEQ